MNELIIVDKTQKLPATMEDLSRFILVGQEKYNSVRAEIRAIEKLKLAEEVRNQKRLEAQMLAEALLDAEVRLGELFKALPTKSGKRTDIEPRSGDGTRLEKCKEEAFNDLGFSKTVAYSFETLAENQELVELVKAESRENGDYPTRTKVLDMAGYQKKRKDEVETECWEYDAIIDLRVSVYRELAKIIDLVDKFEVTPGRMDALSTNFDETLLIDDQIRYINESVDKLNLIKMEIYRRKSHGKKL
jgi:hypothetical protein